MKIFGYEITKVKKEKICLFEPDGKLVKFSLIGDG